MPEERSEDSRSNEGETPVTDDGKTAISTDRTSPVGKPVIRGDPSLTGQLRDEAVEFDPDDPKSLEYAAEIVREFATDSPNGMDSVFLLRGAAACASLVRGEGSYTAAVERAGDDVSVSFIQKWARVHDLPRSVRRHVVTRDISPSAAKHIARLTGAARLHLAWATLDHDLTVREIRAITSDVKDGVDIEDALANQGFTLGEMTLTVPVLEYCKLRQESSLRNESPGDFVGTMVTDRLMGSDEQ
jgi:hypothetical protein